MRKREEGAGCRIASFFGRQKAKTDGTGRAKTLVAEAPVKNRVRSQSQSQSQTQLMGMTTGVNLNAIPSPPFTSSPLPPGDILLGETPLVRVSASGTGSGV